MQRRRQTTQHEPRFFFGFVPAIDRVLLPTEPPRTGRSSRDAQDAFLPTVRAGDLRAAGRERRGGQLGSAELRDAALSHVSGRANILILSHIHTRGTA